jgi:aryl-alcohol dehydrogenase-like predicted oxidoreductase
LSGNWTKDSAGKGDFRAASPRFQGDNAEKNMALAEALQKVAEARGMTASQAAIAWVAAQGDDIVPVIGARKRTQLAESLAAMDKALTAADLATLEAAIPKGSAAGGRYAESQVVHLDSARKSA